MLYKLSRTWAERLAVHSGRDAEIMAYGLEVFLSTVINIVLLCAISLSLGVFGKMLMYIVAFAVMRSMAAGGYHAKNHILCFAQYTVASLAAIYLSMLCASDLYLPIILAAILNALSIFWVFKYAPVETENRPISETENIAFKKKSRIVVVILVLTSAAFLAVRQNTYSLICSFAVFAESVSLLPILNKGDTEK